jgi:hypothetical protein
MSPQSMPSLTAGHVKAALTETLPALGDVTSVEQIEFSFL